MSELYLIINLYNFLISSGLIAGSSTYIKHIFPNVKNYAVEPEEYNDTQVSLEKNSIVKNKETGRSICDALLALNPGNVTFPINQTTLSGGLAVSDLEVKQTIIELAENIKIVDLKNKSSIADAFMIATCRSTKHANATADELTKKLKKIGILCPTPEGRPKCDWIIVDAGSIIVHLFRQEIRDLYSLEKLWNINFDNIETKLA